MLTRFSLRGQGIPNLVIARRVVDKMVSAAMHYAQDETGEALVGLRTPGAEHGSTDTLYVLDTISPDESAVREWHTFQQGDDRQDELIWWLQENWHVFRGRQQGVETAKWDVPLRYLGDWHKQPGYMIAPSHGDLMTALDWIDDPENKTDFLLAPIVTLDHPPTTFNGEMVVNFLTVPQGDGLNARVDFWYISHEARMFMPISPAIYPDGRLPRLTDYPWHLVRQDRFETEMAQLHADQLFTTIVLWKADEQPPLEVCLMAGRLGSDKVMILVTHWNYPEQPPAARIAPFISMGEDEDIYKVFGQMWAQSEPLKNPPGWKWSHDHYLIDYLHALEMAHGLKPAGSQPELRADAAQGVEDELGSR